MTKELEELFTQTGSQEPLGLEAKVLVKFFNPVGAATWFATEFDPATRCFFGWATLGNPQMAELGHFSLDELEAVRLPFGLSIERDLYWKPCTLREVIREHGGESGA
jgi:hypothetical protein